MKSKLDYLSISCKCFTGGILLKKTIGVEKNRMRKKRGGRRPGRTKDIYSNLLVGYPCPTEDRQSCLVRVHGQEITRSNKIENCMNKLIAFKLKIEKFSVVKNEASHPNIDGSGQGNENWYKCYGGILKCACKFMREKACYPNGSCWLESYPHATAKYEFILYHAPKNQTKIRPPNPLPISKPFDAGNDRTALASSASSLSNTGEPSP
ncbi:hypothetical protein SDJN02_21392, partial [Cucurbita argyrosperma subsp. argyrosperma]